MSRLLLVASSRISANVFSAIGLARSLRRSRRCHRGNRECATAVVPRHQLCPAWRYRRYHACLQPRPERFDFYAHICRATMQRIDSRELSSRRPHCVESPRRRDHRAFAGEQGSIASELEASAAIEARGFRPRRHSERLSNPVSTGIGDAGRWNAPMGSSGRHARSHRRTR